MAACWVVIPRDIHGSLLGCNTSGYTNMPACWVVLPRDVHGSLLGCTASGCTCQLVGVYYLGIYMAA